ncbi:ABC transporter related [Streptomyces azureus]|uniref:ABC transporter related n=1 Tax=Streptomyces azureus TaxID=146537 RepID=A0A0K8PWJ5_STRAJ|nr:ABC transporter related [Streptomyces azureus]
MVSWRFARGRPASFRLTSVRCTVDSGRPKTFVNSPTVTGWWWATAFMTRSDLVTLFISIGAPSVFVRRSQPPDSQPDS